MCVFSSSIPLFSQADASEAGLLRYRWRTRLPGVLSVSVSISAKVLIDRFPRHQWQRTKAEVRTKERSCRARQGFSATRFPRWSSLEDFVPPLVGRCLPIYLSARRVDAQVLLCLGAKDLQETGRVALCLSKRMDAGKS